MNLPRKGRRATLLLAMIPGLLCVACGGGGGGSGNKAPPPNSKPVISGPLSFTFDENSPISFQVGTSDADGDVLTFEVLDTADGKFFYRNFGPDWSIFEIKSEKIFDFENPDDADGDSVYELDLRVSDKVSITTARVTVTVADTPGNTYFGETGAAMILGLPRRGDEAGDPIGTIADIDGDGLREIIVGLPWRREPHGSNLGNYTGMAFIVSGARLFDADDGVLELLETGVPGTVRLGGPEEFPDGHVGTAIAEVGDLDGDGLPEMAISERSSSRGSVFVIRGAVLRDAMNGSNYVSLKTLVNDGNGTRLSGNSINDYAGLRVAAIADLDGDGLNELAICAPGEQLVPEFTGTTYLVFGEAIAPLLDGQEVTLGSFVADGDAVRLNGADWATGNCYGLADAGDFNGDGMNDLVIGEPRQLVGGGDNIYRRIHVVFGDAILDARGGSGTITLEGLEASGIGVSLISHDVYDGFARVVAGAGDFNGDGLDDVLVGAPNKLYGEETYNGHQGAAYILFGSATPFTEPVMLDTLAEQGYGIEVQGASVNDNLGFAAAAAGDVNGDGFGDILVGAYHKHVERSYRGEPYWTAGAAYLLFGNTGVPGNTVPLAEPFDGVTMLGINGGDQFGEALASFRPTGDLDGDTVPDLLIGAPYSARCVPDISDPVIQSGAVFAISGQQVLNAYAGDRVIDFADYLPHIRLWSALRCNNPAIDGLR